MDFADWIGRTVVAEEVAERWPIAGLCAALDKTHVPNSGEPILPLGHWIYFPPTVPQSHIGPDGHPRRGDFLPPLRQPRRMWAASDVAFIRPIRLGERVRKTARIANITEKAGKSGSLVFVTVENDYDIESVRVLTETQTLVYRDDPVPGETPPPPKTAPTEPAWSVRVDPDPALLFRYSAVTFNAHRIHYDEPYAKETEGYPAIIVQGQLTATLMLQAFTDAHPGRQPAAFSFRALKPLFSGASFFVEGAQGADQNSFKLWARDADGNLSMTADLRTM